MGRSRLCECVSICLSVSAWHVPGGGHWWQLELTPLTVGAKVVTPAVASVRTKRGPKRRQRAGYTRADSHSGKTSTPRHVRRGGPTVPMGGHQGSQVVKLATPRRATNGRALLSPASTASTAVSVDPPRATFWQLLCDKKVMIASALYGFLGFSQSTHNEVRPRALVKSAAGSMVSLEGEGAGGGGSGTAERACGERL